MGDVRDIGTGIEGRTGRGYTSNAELRFHSDPADVTALFFLRRAKRGGESRLASSVAVHNEIARRRPDLLELLYEPFTVSWQANEPPGEQPWYDMPVYGRANRRRCLRLRRLEHPVGREELRCAAAHAEQIEAVGYVAEVAAEPQFWIERTLEPGSMMFVHNHTAFHMRTEFEDFDDPDEQAPPAAGVAEPPQQPCAAGELRPLLRRRQRRSRPRRVPEPRRPAPLPDH